MTNIPIEDRVQIEDLMTSYCYAVDTLSDINAILGLFLPDGIMDLSGIGLAVLHGHADIRAFFEGVFADMTHHAHYLSNFRVLGFDGAAASAQAYVIGMGRARDGKEILVHVRYRFDVVRTDAGWKTARYAMDLLMPPPPSLAEIHGGH